MMIGIDVKTNFKMWYPRTPLDLSKASTTGLYTREKYEHPSPLYVNYVPDRYQLLLVWLIMYWLGIPVYLILFACLLVLPCLNTRKSYLVPTSSYIMVTFNNWIQTHLKLNINLNYKLILFGDGTDLLQGVPKKTRTLIAPSICV